MHHEQAVALLVLLKPLLTQADVRPLDVVPPPTVAVVRSSAAKIKWKTPAWSDAAVEYGPTTRYGATERTRRHARIHRVVLRGLEPGRTYHYRVSSRESDGAVVVSRDFVFTTPPTVAAGAPARPAHSAGATSRSRSSS